jgi:hypothetical protein
MRDVLACIALVILTFFLGLMIHLAADNPPEVILADIKAALRIYASYFLIAAMVVIFALLMWVMRAPDSLWDAGLLVKKCNRGKVLTEEEKKRLESLIASRVVEGCGFAQARSGERIIQYRITSETLSRYD